MFDGGQLLYCSNCGAPQIFLSEELQEETALEVQRYSERAAAGSAELLAETTGEAATEGTTSAARRETRRRRMAEDGRWPLAVEFALISGGVALGLDAAGMAFDPVLLLAWLWAVSAPILTVGFYNTRSRAVGMTPGFAARLGLLTGVLVTAGCAVVLTADLVLSRFVFRNGVVDREITAAITQLHANAQTQYGNAAAAPIFHFLAIPEFRVGLMLWLAGFSAALYLLVCVTSAGIAGLLLSRRRPA